MAHFSFIHSHPWSQLHVSRCHVGFVPEIYPVHRLDQGSFTRIDRVLVVIDSPCVVNVATEATGFEFEDIRTADHMTRN